MPLQIRRDPAPSSTAGAAAPRGGAVRAWWPAVVVVALALLLAAALRLPGLTSSLPATQPDEPTVVTRAQGWLAGETTPPGFDWPLGASLLAAGGIRVGETLGVTSRDGSVTEVYGFLRWVFAAVALATVAATGWLAAVLAGDAGRGAPAAARHAVAVAAGVGAGIVAVDFVMVRLSRQVQPDHAQALAVLLALLAAVVADRATTTRARVAGWLGAGALAGVAGGMKYLGITAAAVPAVAALTRGGVTWSRRILPAAGVAVAAVAGFVVATGGTVVSGAFVDGFVEQVLHQRGGHLGYDHGGPTWWHHLVVTLPGSLGWAVVVAVVAAVGWALVAGDRGLRLVAGYAVGLYAVIGLSRIEFPHYVVIVVPVLAAVTGAAAGRGVRAARSALGRRAVPWLVVAAGLVVAALVPPALNGVRLLRSTAAPDTREVVPARLGAALAEAGLVDVPLWTESYTGVGAAEAEATGGRLVFGFGEAPEVLDCACVALVSSYQEQRYAADPRTAVVYERLRQEGRVLVEVAPGVPLSYRWDLLPTWGLGAVPLAGDLPALGPTVTALDLTEGGR